MSSRIPFDVTSTHVPHVLVVDDSKDIHRLIDGFLAPIGVRTSFAFGGEEGIRLAKETRPNLILLDYQMPDCNGIEVLKQLREDANLSRIPVIMITASNDQTLIASAFENGVCDYINKPLIPVVLHARVRSALKTQALIEDLRKRARYDGLTGLPNKDNFIERLQRSIEASRKGQSFFAVMFIDFDRFKWINDSLGHDCGDQSLKEASERLKRSVRCTDLVANGEQCATVARFGGDEFVILLESIPSTREAESIASRILAVMQEPFMVAGRTLYLSASIGIVNGWGQYQSPEDVIRDADIAMYEAKESGRGCYRFFNGNMRNRVIRRWQVDADLRQAIELDQFQLLYQPIVCLKSGLVESVEALIRWNHPERGFLSPGEFIPTAEETGMIVPIGEWVMRTACKQYAAWSALDRGATPAHISINLSRQQLVQSDFIDVFQSALLESGIAASRVHLEITESEMMNDLPTCIKALESLRSLGAKIDLDDFGTGYSSLACLHQLPIDVLKLDRSLISSLTSGNYFSKLVDLVLKMLLGTEIQVVAEGVETPEQLKKLRRLGCHLGQGYFFSKPIDAASVLPFVCNRHSKHTSCSPRNPPFDYARASTPLTISNLQTR
jgi:diguanylate cyclase (GGDEF)-like protein